VVDACQDTLLMSLVRMYQSMSSGTDQIMRAWLARTVDLARTNFVGQTVISIALHATDATEYEHTPIRVLLESGRFDLNRLDPSLSNTSIFYRLASVPSRTLALKIVSHLLDANPLCIDWTMCDEKGRTLDMQVKDSKSDNGVSDLFTQHKALVDTTFMPLVVRHVEVYTQLPTVLCELVRQYIDGTGNALAPQKAEEEEKAGRAQS
jgi:hypothetical protein